MFCRKCGKELSDNVKFCMHCGNPVETGLRVQKDDECGSDTSNDAMTSSGAVTQNGDNTDTVCSADFAAEKKKNNIKVYIILGLIVVAIVGSGGLLYFREEIKEFKDARRAKEEAAAFDADDEFMDDADDEFAGDTDDEFAGDADDAGFEEDEFRDDADDDFDFDEFDAVAREVEPAPAVDPEDYYDDLYDEDFYGEDSYDGEYDFARPKAVQKANTAYLCPWSASEPIDSSNWPELRRSIEENYPPMPADKSIAQMVINEIYARHGYKFKTEEIGEYFSKQLWYDPVTDDMNEIGAMLNPIEMDNVKFLQKVE